MREITSELTKATPRASAPTAQQTTHVEGRGIDIDETDSDVTSIKRKGHSCKTPPRVMRTKRSMRKEDLAGEG